MKLFKLIADRGEMNQLVTTLSGIKEKYGHEGGPYHHFIAEHQYGSADEAMKSGSFCLFEDHRAKNSKGAIIGYIVFEDQAQITSKILASALGKSIKILVLK